MAFTPGATTATAKTLVDWAKLLDPDGTVASVAELMTETNDILEDAMFVQGNLPTGHRTTVRNGLPTATWRKLNYGVMPSKSTTTQVTDTTGMLETYSEVDKDLADLNGNTAEFRMSEDRPFIESMNQTLAQTIFYGDTATYPERFLGLTPRYDALGNPSKPGNAYLNHVIDAGGTTNLTSIWLVVWGENTCHMIFPKGSKAGITHEDKGQVTLFDDDGGRYEGYRAHYQFKAGLTVRDWRYVVRIANVDSAGTFDYTDLIKAINALPNMGMGKAVIYCNRAVKTQMDIAATNTSNVLWRTTEVFGKPVTSFWGIPVRQCDALLNTEAQLT